MAQLSLYLEEEAMTALREDAARSGVSISRYAGEIISARNTVSGWPSGFFDLYGSLTDDISFDLPEDEFISEDDIPALEIDYVYTR